MDHAGRDIVEALQTLVAQMRERGHEKARARFTLDTADSPAVFLVALNTGGDAAFARYGTQIEFAHCRGDTPTEAFWDASAAVRGMAESLGKQCAPWFTTQQHPPTGAADGGDGAGASTGGTVAAEILGEGVT
jgi:hypothetical protein